MSQKACIEVCGLHRPLCELTAECVTVHSWIMFEVCGFVFTVCVHPSGVLQVEKPAKLPSHSRKKGGTEKSTGILTYRKITFFNVKEE